MSVVVCSFYKFGRSQNDVLANGLTHVQTGPGFYVSPVEVF